MFIDDHLGTNFLRFVSGVFGVKLSYLQTIYTAGKEDHTEYRKCLTERIVTSIGGDQGGLDETFGKALIGWDHTLPRNRAGAIGVSANTAFNCATIDANPATAATPAQPPEG